MNKLLSIGPVAFEPIHHFVRSTNTFHLGWLILSNALERSNKSRTETNIVKNFSDSLSGILRTGRELFEEVSEGSC